jgi:hypothetical protein
MRVVAEDERQQARALLGSLAVRSTFVTLMGTPEPPLSEWVATRSFDLLIVPRERLARGGGRVARELRTGTAAEVQLV